MMAEGEFEHKPLSHKVDDKTVTSNGIEEEPDFSDPEDFEDKIDEQGNRNLPANNISINLMYILIV